MMQALVGQQTAQKPTQNNNKITDPALLLAQETFQFDNHNMG